MANLTEDSNRVPLGNNRPRLANRLRELACSRIAPELWLVNEGPDDQGESSYTAVDDPRDMMAWLDADPERKQYHPNALEWAGNLLSQGLPVWNKDKAPEEDPPREYPPIFKRRELASFVFVDDEGAESVPAEDKLPAYFRSKTQMFIRPFVREYKELWEALQACNIERVGNDIIITLPAESEDEEPQTWKRAEVVEDLCHYLALEPTEFATCLELLDHFDLVRGVDQEILEEEFQRVCIAAEERADEIAEELTEKFTVYEEWGKIPACVEQKRKERGCCVFKLPLSLAYTPSEEGNAALIVDVLGKDIRYVVESGRFIKWNGSCWEWVLDDFCLLKAGQLSEWWQEATDGILSPQAFKIVHAWYRACGKRSTIQNSIALVKSHESIRVSLADLDNKPHLLNVKNGTIDLESWEFREHRREDLLTLVSDVEYAPRATSPNYDAFARGVLNNDSETLACVHRNLGATLTGMVKNPVLMMMVGSGSNGKTTFMSLMPKILGKQFSWVSAALITARQGDAESASPMRLTLKGARGVGINESGHKDRLHDDELKRLVDTNPITARGLHERPVTFLPTHTLWMATNVCPRLDHVDAGVKRRIVTVEFGVTYRDHRSPDFDPELHQPIDPDLEDKLDAETSGILNRWLQGYTDWKNRGYQIAPEGEVLRSTHEYFDEEDRYEQFFEERLAESGDPNQFLSSKELHAAYAEWLGDPKYAGLPRTLTAAMKKSEKLQKLGARPARERSGTRGFRGLALVTTAARITPPISYDRLTASPN